MLTIEWIALYMLIGSLVGFLAGLLGVGGGGLLVPILASLFAYQGVSYDKAVPLALGTSLACMIISSAASLRAHAMRGTVRWDAFYGMAPGVALGAFLTTRVAAQADSAHIALFFAAFMMLVALQMFLNWLPKTSNRPLTLRNLLFTGAGIGSVSALAAVGGGFLTVTFLSHKKIAMREAVGTSAATGLPIALAGTIGYWINGWSRTLEEANTLGFIYVPAFFAISAASALASPYGARCAHNLPEKQLKRVFAVICLILSVHMFFSVGS